MTFDDDAIKSAVQDRYAGHARTKTSCCSGGCNCGDSDVRLVEYAPEDLASIPSDADLGLGCGSPLSLAAVRPGDTVLDLGSGGGIDCFLAANRVGSTGHVIGVDMTPEMILLAQHNARQGGYENVEFRLGEMEDLPVENDSVDLILSNCVINLVPDKDVAFAEALRVLKPGGAISVSDIVTTAALPDSVGNSVGAYVACLGGALVREDYLAAIESAGFTDVRIVAENALCSSEDEAREMVALSGFGDMSLDDAMSAALLFRSVTVSAIKPSA